MKTASVSVVIPFYNPGGQLERAVRSVFAQSFSDWELILVDDGSSDGSRASAAQLIAGEARARLISQENQGVSSARNRGTAEASADLIAFLDSDDCWMPEFLERGFNLRGQFTQCALWGCRSVIDNGGKRIIPRVTGLPDSETGILHEFFDTAGGFPALSTGTAIIDRDELISCGGFPEGIRWGEDCDTWIRLALRNRFAVCHYQGLVIHMAAENRASLSEENRSYPLSGPEVERIYLDRLDKEERANSLIEYMNWFRLVAAADCLRLGQRETAKGMLRLASDTRKFRKHLNRLKIKSLAPASVMKTAARLRSYL